MLCFAQTASSSSTASLNRRHRRGAAVLALWQSDLFVEGGTASASRSILPALLSSSGSKAGGRWRDPPGSERSTGSLARAGDIRLDAGRSDPVPASAGSCPTARPGGRGVWASQVSVSAALMPLPARQRRHRPSRAGSEAFAAASPSMPRRSALLPRRGPAPARRSAGGVVGPDPGLGAAALRCRFRARRRNHPPSAAVGDPRSAQPGGRCAAAVRACRPGAAGDHLGLAGAGAGFGRGCVASIRLWPRPRSTSIGKPSNGRGPEAAESARRTPPRLRGRPPPAQPALDSTG